MSNEDALSKRIDTLSPERRLLLEQMRKERREQAVRGDTIPPRQCADECPLSFAQESLWFLHQLEPGRRDYNIPAALHLKGRLNVAALERCLAEVVRRHEVLRTTFKEVNGAPVQVVAPARTVPLAVEDLTEVPASEREGLALRLSAEEAQRPFDLARGPLLRAGLLRLAPDEHVLLMTMHHVVSDNWSAGLLVNELVTLYEAFAAGRPSPLQELPIQYADYAVWQRGWLRGEVLGRQLDYWRRQLADAPRELRLVTERPRGDAPSRRGGLRTMLAPPETAEALKALSRREGVTLFMTLLAAFKALLYLYTNQEDIPVGTPIANRNRPEIEPLIGFFVNTLVLRTRFSGHDSFRQLLRRVREVCLGAYAHQDLPFERLVEELQPQRDARGMPLFQVMFGMPNAPTGGGNVQPSGLQLSPLERGDVFVAYDLTLFMGERDGGLVALLGYDSELYEGAVAERMLGHMMAVLEQVGRNPDGPLADIELTEGEPREGADAEGVLRRLGVDEFDF